MGAALRMSSEPNITHRALRSRSHDSPVEKLQRAKQTLGKRARCPCTGAGRTELADTIEPTRATAAGACPHPQRSARPFACARSDDRRDRFVICRSAKAFNKSIDLIIDLQAAEPPSEEVLVEIVKPWATKCANRHVVLAMRTIVRALLSLQSSRVLDRCRWTANSATFIA